MLKDLFLYSVFEHQPKFSKQGPKKNDNFSDFAKHRLFKNILLQPPSWPKIGVFQIFERKNIDAEQETQLKTREKTKIRERDLKEKTRQMFLRKDWWKNFSRNILMLFFSWNKSKEERKRQKQGSKKKEKKEERKEQERDREEKVKKGRQKKGWGETKGDTEK